MIYRSFVAALLAAVLCGTAALANLVQFGATGGGCATTWDTAAHNQNVTFSGGNLTVTTSNTSSAWAQSTTSKAAGAGAKVHWQWTRVASTSNFFSIGGGNQSFDISSQIPGFDGAFKSFSWNDGLSTVELGGTDISGGTAPTIANGDTGALEWDVDAKTIQVNNLTAGSGWKGPFSLANMGIANANVTLFIMFGDTSATGDSGTLNTCSGSPQAGYALWN